MPRYTYLCENCESVTTVFHLMKEKLESCGNCGSEKVSKIPSQLSAKITRHNKVGDKVKEGIETNKEILKQQIKDSRKDYDG